MATYGTDVVRHMQKLPRPQVAPDPKLHRFLANLDLHQLTSLANFLSKNSHLDPYSVHISFLLLVLVILSA